MKESMKRLRLIALAISVLWMMSACSEEAAKQEVTQVADPAPQAETLPTVQEVLAEHLDVSVAEFQERMTQKAGLLLDVRTPEEVAQGVIEGATVLDYYGDQFAEELAKLDTNQTVYVYCRSGGRSGKTMAQLKDLGFAHVYNLDGGITAWKAAGMPMAQGVGAE